MHTSAHTQHLLAVDDNGVVSSPPLYFGHFLNHISDGLKIGAPSIRCPVGDMELSHLVSFLRLHKKNISIWIQVHMDCPYISFKYTKSPNGKSLQLLLSDQVNRELSKILYSTTRPVLMATLL